MSTKKESATGNGVAAKSQGNTGTSNDVPPNRPQPMADGKYKRGFLSGKTTTVANQQQRSVNLCGLWIKTSQKGHQYLCGSMAGVFVQVFENTSKDHNDPTHNDRPDFNLVLTQKPPKAVADSPEPAE